MRKVLILGDTHANAREMVLSIELAANQDIHDILVVGDFGYWPDPHLGHPNFLTDTSQAAVLNGVTVWWVDGNHEDFGALYLNHLQHHDEPVQISPGVVWLPRGVTWEWEGVSFLAMGGAASVDRRWRTLGLTWFKEEMISDEDVAKAVPADIVISHDAPVNPLNYLGERFVVDPESEFCRQQMRKVVNIAQPDVLFHGHYHAYTEIDHLREGGYTKCIGLGCDGNPQNKMILTLDAGEWKVSKAFPAPWPIYDRYVPLTD
ncbi:MAG: metallophosphoesterase [Actinobacteria bacterium]|nr:metallophosphoesterase [Actinomycetota bacterium]